MTDTEYLQLAINEGNEVAGPYNFGAIVVKDDVVISSEHNQVHTQHNPALHAEISAIATACKRLKSNHIDGTTLYCSHEPCLMCFSCASWAHIDRIVYATAAEEVPKEMYEYKDINLQEMSTKLLRPMKIEHIPTKV